MKKKVAIFPTTSNPPTFGTILGLYGVVDDYDKIYVVIKDRTYVMNPEHVKDMLQTVLCKYSSKFKILIRDYDFKHDTTFPRLPEYDNIITDDIEIQANLKSKGYVESILIPTPIGWDDTFHRIAYCRSAIYTQLQNSVKTIRVPISKRNKKKGK
jgi:hypothetical protein